MLLHFTSAGTSWPKLMTTILTSVSKRAPLYSCCPRLDVTLTSTASARHRERVMLVALNHCEYQSVSHSSSISAYVSARSNKRLLTGLHSRWSISCVRIQRQSHYKNVRRQTLSALFNRARINEWLSARDITCRSTEILKLLKQRLENQMPMSQP